tara:strand:+ start:183 stop:494 length:312 start_codon:yes stop_codon:yes gene_type:complete
MSGKSGPGVPKNLKKVKPGYDQAFTLPKGTSAAPIKQVAKGSSSVWSKVKMKDAKKFILKPAKKATKKQVKKNLQPIKDLGTGTAIGTVVASHIQGNRNNKRP